MQNLFNIIVGFISSKVGIVTLSTVLVVSGGTLWVVMPPKTTTHVDVTVTPEPDTSAEEAKARAKLIQLDRIEKMINTEPARSGRDWSTNL